MKVTAVTTEQDPIQENQTLRQSNADAELENTQIEDLVNSGQ